MDATITKTPIEMILEDNTFEVVLKSRRTGADIPFRLRRLSLAIRLKVQGAGTFGQIRGAMQAGDDTVDEAKYFELVELYLRECLISPALAAKGQNSSIDEDVISFADLGDYAADLMVELKDSMGGDVETENFPESSDEKTEPSSPGDSMP